MRVTWPAESSFEKTSRASRALIGLIFAFKSYLIGTAPLFMAVAIMMLELFVAFLQAFIFTFLTTLFIGMSVVFHHDDHHEHHEAAAH